MAGVEQSVTRITEVEYLRLEFAAPDRHEFVDGVVRAMTGARRAHNLCVGEIFAPLHSAAKADGCRVFQEGQRLRIAAQRRYYPDVMVVCAAEPDDPYIEEAPCLLVEVLSPTTATVDRGEKLIAYRSRESLRHYLVVDLDAGFIEHHHRASPLDPWAFDVAGAGGVIALHCPEMLLDVGQVLGDSARLVLGLDDDSV